MRKAVRLIVAGRPCGEVVIDLSQEEQRLFHVLLQAAQLAERRTTVRIAGGWVRDKLLGRTSHDIDVTLDNCTGRDFAEAVNSFLRAHGEKTSTIGVIAANPEQSKHLETATCRVLDHWIDFVHLRTEVYEPGSRIPRVTFGTALQVRCVPAKAAIACTSVHATSCTIRYSRTIAPSIPHVALSQDAERRDFTVNALFFNLSDACVEDMTGRGCEDLAAHVLRTPLPPRTTFLDDPLRVMRAVRFAARLRFQLLPEVRSAACDEDVRAALAAKISRERIGKEVEGMLTGASPVLAMRMLRELQLLGAVLLVPVSPASAAVPAESAADNGVAVYLVGGIRLPWRRGQGSSLAPMIATQTPADGESPAAIVAGAAAIAQLEVLPGSRCATDEDNGMALNATANVAEAFVARPDTTASPQLLDLGPGLGVAAAAAGAPALPPRLDALSADVDAAWRRVGAALVESVNVLYGLSPLGPEGLCAAAATANTIEALDAPTTASCSPSGPGSAFASIPTTEPCAAYVPDQFCRVLGVRLISASDVEPAATVAHATAGGVPPDSGFSTSEVRSLLLAASLWPASGLHVVTASNATTGNGTAATSTLARRETVEPAVFASIAWGLKLRHRDAEDASAICDAALAFQSLVRTGTIVVGPTDGIGAATARVRFPASTRLAAALLLRDVARERWRAAAFLAAAADALPALLPALSRRRATGKASMQPEEVRQLWIALAPHAALAKAIAGPWALGAGQWDAKPLLDGRALMVALGLSRGGPAIGAYGAALVRWQLMHPGAGAEDATRALAQLRLAGGPGAPIARSVLLDGIADTDIDIGLPHSG